MPGRAAEAAPAAAEPTKRASCHGSTAANDAKAKKLAERRKKSHDAAVWAHNAGKGSKAACKQEQFKGITYNMVEPLLRELKANGSIAAERDHHCQAAGGRRAKAALGLAWLRDDAQRGWRGDEAAAGGQG